MKILTVQLQEDVMKHGPIVAEEASGTGSKLFGENDGEDETEMGTRASRDAHGNERGSVKHRQGQGRWRQDKTDPWIPEEYRF
jgi:hypothetical protein